MEILEEIKEQEALDMRSNPKPVICEGKVSMETDDNNEDKNKNNPAFTVFVSKGEINCAVGDYLALSPTNASSVFRERKYILEVKSCAGKHLYADSVWPNHNEVGSELSRSPAWKVTPFPNLVSFNRMLTALKNLCTETSLENTGIFSELLNCYNEASESRVLSESSEENQTTKVNQASKLKYVLFVLNIMNISNQYSSSQMSNTTSRVLVKAK